MIVLDYNEITNQDIRARIIHWIAWFHVLQEEHFSRDPHIVLELTVNDFIKWIEYHFYFKNVKE